METKLTVIVDNIGFDGIAGEWGLCILAEFNGKKILIDSGQSDLFAENLKKTGFDIKDIDYATLSHAHYDHANGMPRFFEENKKAKLYIRDAAKENCYRNNHFIFKKYIGMPKGMLEKYGDRIAKLSGDFKLMEGAYLFPHKTKGLEKVGMRDRMYQKKSGRMKYDNFDHEQSLVLDTDKGLIIINCCSHGGAVNIINEVRETFPDKRVYGIIGGFHLFNKTDEEVREVAKKIDDTGIQFVCTGHCTGERAYRILKEKLGDKLSQLHVGLKMKF